MDQADPEAPTAIWCERVRDAGWNILVHDSPFRVPLPSRDPLDLPTFVLAATGFNSQDLICELQAAIAYALGRDREGRFRGTITIYEPDSVLSPVVFTEIGRPPNPDIGRFNVYWKDGVRLIVHPVDLLGVRGAITHAAYSPPVSIEGGFLVEGSRSGNSFSVLPDCDKVESVLKRVLPTYGLPVVWDPKALAELSLGTLAKDVDFY